MIRSNSTPKKTKASAQGKNITISLHLEDFKHVGAWMQSCVPRKVLQFFQTTIPFNIIRNTHCLINSKNQLFSRLDQQTLFFSYIHTTLQHWRKQLGIYIKSATKLSIPKRNGHSNYWRSGSPSVLGMKSISALSPR